MAAETFSKKQIGGALSLALVAGCIPALQPILLGGLLAEHRLTASQIGEAATTEAIGMAASAAIAGALLKPTHLRMIALVAAIGLCIANGLTLVADGIGILAARALNGAASGMLLWILVGLVTRTANPGRMFAVYVLLQAIFSFLLAALFSIIVMPHLGAAGGYGILVVFSILLLIPITLIESSYCPVSGIKDSRVPTVWGSIGLLAVCLNFAAFFSLWVYLVPFGEYLGLSKDAVTLAISAAIAFQILGGLASYACAGHTDGSISTSLATAISAVLILTLYFHPTLYAFYISLCLIAFLYTFSAPFHVSLLITADESHRSAIYVSSAQLIGVACGPMIASFTVYDGNFAKASVVSVCLYVAASCSALASRAGRVSSAQLLPTREPSEYPVDIE